MPLVITDVSRVTTDYLTLALTHAGALSHGAVEQVEIEAGSGTWSKIAHLRPRYSSDARGELPPTLLLKMCTGTFGRSEVDYLTRDYTHVADAPIPRCYDAQFDLSIPAYHLLMDDHTATHGNNFDVLPTLEYGEALAEAAAALHAPYWRPEQRAALGPIDPPVVQFERYLAHSVQGLKPLIVATQDDITDVQRATLHTVFAKHPAAARARLNDSQGLTIIHGDLNPGNILSPSEGARPIYLIDRQPFDWSLTTWYGVADLAYAMVHWWPIELRRLCEQPVLRRYHMELHKRGVEGYAWEQLWNDYRLMAMLSLYVAVEWCVLPEDRERMRWVWFPKLEKALTAFNDLQCGELL